MKTRKETEEIRAYYAQSAQTEWARLEEHPFEFLLTTGMMDRYIKPGDRILDIGGGPGRYAIHYAKRGCVVTLVDLVQENIDFAKEKAREEGVHLNAHAANCLDIDTLGLSQYDHVFLMGPLYHLLREEERVEAVEKALARLKGGGVFYASFILAFAGVIYNLKNGGFIARDMQSDFGEALIRAIEDGKNYEGRAFTQACFYHQEQILPFMARFGLEKLHLFGQEGILAPNEQEILARDKEEIDTWIALAMRLAERPELLAYAEHAMYIGRKPGKEGEDMREGMEAFVPAAWRGAGAPAYLEGTGDAGVKG